MRPVHHCSTIVSFALALTVWLAAGQLTPAAGAEPTGRPALTLTLSQRERGLGAWDAPGCRLEERLFADVADGRLDEFSPLDAALVASGVDNVDSLRHYQQKAAVLAAQLRSLAALAETPHQQVETVFEFLHRQVLRGGYDLAYTDLRRVLDDGRFNCVRATVLMNYLAGQLGLDCRGLEMPGHAMTRVPAARGRVGHRNDLPPMAPPRERSKRAPDHLDQRDRHGGRGRPLEGPRGLADPDGGDDLLQPGCGSSR